jgi:Transposase IS116/IS110/IS902 family
VGCLSSALTPGHAKAALKMQINKSDRNDAVDIARIMQCGWYKEVCIKDLDSHAIKALLASRALLVKIKRDLENQIRGLLKNLGLVIGRAKMNVFATRAMELTEARPELGAAVEPLLKSREAVGQQIADLDRKVMQLARDDVQVRRFMTAPGVGPITALCFLATIDDPARFRRSRSVGAYSGLTTRRYASGETDWTGRISKCGDKMLRSYLYEAAMQQGPPLGVIGIQSGPPNRGATSASMILGSRGWNAGRGDDCKDSSSVLQRREAHQSDMLGSGRIPQSRKEGDPFGGDRVPLRARSPAAAQDRAMER